MKSKSNNLYYLIATILVAAIVISFINHSVPTASISQSPTAQVTLNYKDGTVKTLTGQQLSLSSIVSPIDGSTISSMNVKIYMTPILSAAMGSSDTLRTSTQISNIAILRTSIGSISGGYKNYLNANGDLYQNTSNLIAERTYTESELNSIMSVGLNTLELYTNGLMVDFQQLGRPLKSSATFPQTLMTISLSMVSSTPTPTPSPSPTYVFWMKDGLAYRSPDNSITLSGVYNKISYASYNTTQKYNPVNYSKIEMGFTVRNYSNANFTSGFMGSQDVFFGLKKRADQPGGGQEAMIAFSFTETNTSYALTSNNILLTWPTVPSITMPANLRIVITNGNRVEWYMNGILVNTETTVIPNDDMWFGVFLNSQAISDRPQISVTITDMRINAIPKTTPTG